MKKQIAVIPILFVLAATLAACQESNAPAQATPVDHMLPACRRNTSKQFEQSEKTINHNGSKDNEKKK